jgi:hypothetical protein
MRNWNMFSNLYRSECMQQQQQQTTNINFHFISHTCLCVCEANRNKKIGEMAYSFLIVMFILFLNIQVRYKVRRFIFNFYF